MSGAGSGSMFKLAILGDGGVGKTALVIQLCLNKFVETYDPTIEDSYRKRVLLDEHAITLELMDTAGQEEYLGLQDQWIRDGEGFLLVYSVTQRVSFTRIKQYYHEIQRIKDGEPFGVVIVGNKVDQSGGRQVSTQEGEQLAQSWGVPFFETSAKMNINAEVAFLTLARLTRDKRSGEDSSLPDTVEDIAPGPALAAGAVHPEKGAVAGSPAGTPAAADPAQPMVNSNSQIFRPGSYNTVQQPEPPAAKLHDDKEPGAKNSQTPAKNQTKSPAKSSKPTSKKKSGSKGKCLVM